MTCVEKGDDMVDVEMVEELDDSQELAGASAVVEADDHRGVNEWLNRLRAAVLGANDGIVSVAAVLTGVAGATTDTGAVAIAAMAAVVGGAISMALGEYVSVSSQRDTERARGFHEDDMVNPWSAAIASFIAFFVGAMLPVAAALISSVDYRVPVTFVVTLLALALTGAISARLGKANVGRAVARLVIGGALALGATYLVGRLFGVNVA